MTKQWAQEAELIQELLDSGLSRRGTADSLEMCHKTVGRIIDRFGLEFYKAFDEDAHAVTENKYYSEWDFEDTLDEWIRKAMEFIPVVIPQPQGTSDKFTYELYAYLDYRYGGIGAWLEKECRHIKENFFKKCNECGVLTQVDSFYRRMSGGVEAKCKSCFYEAKDKPSMWLRSRAHTNKRRALQKYLPGVWNVSQRNQTLHEFPTLVLDEEYADDHFIPLSTGHCGTYLGNMSPLSRTLNSSKSDANPFEWFEANRQRFDLEQSAFDALVVKLAQQNGLTSEELRDFTYWCFANQRNIDEVRADNERYGYKRPSLEIWREAVGLPFPIRVDFGDLSLDIEVAA